MKDLLPLIHRLAEIKQWRPLLKVLYTYLKPFGSECISVEIIRSSHPISYTIDSFGLTENGSAVITTGQKFDIQLIGGTQITFNFAFTSDSNFIDFEGLEALLHLVSSRCETTTKLTQVSHSAWQKLSTKQTDEKIIAVSSSMRTTLEQAALVAPYSTPVLLNAESGCGKELLANYIHQNSTRKNKSLLKINCATIPHNLIESALFGHEKGSFTGATELKKGYFERAHGGTLFLDEIGELCLDVQSKLLRILETGDYERVGGKQTLKVDVRLISATHKDLKDAIQKKTFRQDLFYRLNTFPLIIEALRKRPEDLLPLTEFLLKQLSKKLNIEIRSFSKDFEAHLYQHSWPGNGRELRNELERALILTQGKELKLFLKPLPHKSMGLSFEDGVKAIIINALQKCDGKVQGTGSASELLKLNPQTLYSKIRKYGIILNE